jgi:hypothetical protein
LNPTERLDEQLTLLTALCEGYDGGNRADAIRMGTPLRAIFHQTLESPSLLAQLGKRHVDVLSTGDKIPDGVTYWPNLVNWTLWPHESIFACTPKLGSARTKRMVALDFWWGSEAVYKAGHFKLHRSDLVLDAANRAGAEPVVEVKLPDAQKGLLEGAGWKAILKPDANPGREIVIHFARDSALRQVAYEVLHSPAILGLAGRVKG